MESLVLSFLKRNIETRTFCEVAFNIFILSWFFNIDNWEIQRLDFHNLNESTHKSMEVSNGQMEWTFNDTYLGSLRTSSIEDTWF